MLSNLGKGNVMLGAMTRFKRVFEVVFGKTIAYRDLAKKGIERWKRCERERERTEEKAKPLEDDIRYDNFGLSRVRWVKEENDMFWIQGPSQYDLKHTFKLLATKKK